MPFPDAARSDLPPTDLDRLRVALAIQVAREIADADGILDISEVEILSDAFPSSWLRRCGFLDDRDQLNDTVDEYRDRALRELPRRLDLVQKLEMISLFHRTCLADSELHEAELELLTDVARRLHVPIGAFRKHVAGLNQPSTVPPVLDLS